LVPLLIIIVMSERWCNKVNDRIQSTTKQTTTKLNKRQLPRNSVTAKPPKYQSTCRARSLIRTSTISQTYRYYSKHKIKPTYNETPDETKDNKKKEENNRNK